MAEGEIGGSRKLGHLTKITFDDLVDKKDE